ncbi:hypothetical protein BESB_054110 [Besnoitia besnoiti]|uniref:Sm domain-containing protein n=1 Tax=Besnoitia besnoiti TaxID=94643 RepID=A0A2A9MK23_BESBE|nr:hypothetical protein BESB_054110 [Besnoitia besnoiti]PFH35760.1 hypothetical protein BESB_054110 [Besnoitia besnoiti]
MRSDVAGERRRGEDDAPAGEGFVEESCFRVKEQLEAALLNREGGFENFFQQLCNAEAAVDALQGEGESVKIILTDARELRGNLIAVDAKGNLLLQNCRMRTCVKYGDEGVEAEEWRESFVPVPLLCPASWIKSFRVRLDFLLSA